MTIERTFVMLKPNAIQRSLIGTIIGRFEQKGLKLVAAKFMQVDSAQAKLHYAEHKEKPFFSELVGFITSDPVMCMILEGDNAVTRVRNLVGHTNPAQAAPGTIRGDFGVSITKNLVHASDSSAAAKREIALYFSENEIIDYNLEIEKHF